MFLQVGVYEYFQQCVDVVVDIVSATILLFTVMALWTGQNYRAYRN